LKKLQKFYYMAQFQSFSQTLLEDEMGQFIDFDYVKKNADFKVVLQDYGVDFKMNGSSPEIRAHCPFHDDENPSMSVNFDKKVFTCHAASCGEKGNILEFVNLMEDSPGLRPAAKILADMCGIDLAAPKSAKTRGGRKSHAKPKKRARSQPNEEDSTSEYFADEDEPAGFDDDPEPEAPRGTNKVLDFTLNLDPDHEYAKTRHLSSSAVTRFEMGFCNRGIMKGRWCVPIHNAEGELVAYAGRWTGKKRPKDEPKYKLPPHFDKNRVLFNLHRVLGAQWKQVVVVEGIFDAIRLHDLGAPVVALLGSSISEEQVRLIGENFISAYVMLDGGADKARMKVVDRLAQEILVKSVILPDGEDPASVDDDLIINAVPGPVLG
jgi:DNA primase